MSAHRSTRVKSDPKVIEKASKQLSWLLRHGAIESGLAMDAAGWAAIDDVLRATSLSRPELDAVVRLNNKSRLEVRGDRIRACQGHSREGVPVTLEALEASWERYEGPESAWHGTNLVAALAIAREGILPGARTHVHLAPATDSKVGKRAQVDVLLEVGVERLRAAGIGVFQSGNGVLLCRSVPPDCIVGLEPATVHGQRQEAMLRDAFGLPA